jgi:quinol monooxygenase YgiN
MFERYTDRARRTLFFARYEASELGSFSIETEHLLLGLIREGKGLTSRIFAHWDLSLDGIKQEIERRTTVSHDKVPTSVEIPFSKETRRVLQFAAEEADRLLHNYIGTEHLLLGILREERSVAAAILIEKGLRFQAVREDIVQIVGEKDRARGPEHIVLVQVTVRPEMLDEFERALLHNAQQSVKADRGCLRFDVSQHADDPARWVLHEVYTSPEAHAAHRQSSHFLEYDEVASRAIVDKVVVRGTGKHIVR